MKIQIGKLGLIEFQKGYYCYVGSALKNQLINRVKRHLRSTPLKKIHWHIDYFLSNLEIKIIKLILIPSKFREECNLAKTIKILSKSSIFGFGSSDCKCKSHLFYFGMNTPIV